MDVRTNEACRMWAGEFCVFELLTFGHWNVSTGFSADVH